MATASSRTLPIAFDLEVERGSDATLVIDPPADIVITAGTGAAYFYRNGGTVIAGSSVTGTLASGTLTVLWNGVATEAIAAASDAAERTRVYYRATGTVNGVPGSLIASGFLTIYPVGDERIPTVPVVVNPTEASGGGGGVSAGDLASAVAPKADLASPAFTGTPTVPTATPGTNTTQAASTAFVTAAVAAGGGGGGAPLASPAFTGNPTAPTPAPGDADTSIATTAFVANAVSGKADTTALTSGLAAKADTTALTAGLALKADATALAAKADIASPAFTGNPTAPTPTPGDNDTSIATTAFVAGEIAAHTADTSDAHDASAISVLDAAGRYTATDVEGVLAELPSQFTPQSEAQVQTWGKANGTLHGNGAMSLQTFYTYGNVAPFALCIGGINPFDGQQDDLFLWGYNRANGGAKFVTAEASCGFQIEANVRDSSDSRFPTITNNFEWNLDVNPPGTDPGKRFMAFRCDRNDPTDYAHWIFGISDVGTAGHFKVHRVTDGFDCFDVDVDGNTAIGGNLSIAAGGDLSMNGDLNLGGNSTISVDLPGQADMLTYASGRLAIKQATTTVAFEITQNAGAATDLLRCYSTDGTTVNMRVQAAGAIQWASDVKLSRSSASVLAIDVGAVAATIGSGAGGVDINASGASNLRFSATGGLVLRSNTSLGATPSFGGGANVFGINNATTVPTTNPAGGGIVYCEAGALKYRGSSGTITTLAAA